MSEFVIEKFESETKSLFDSYITIKTTDPKWKLNKPCVVSEFFQQNAHRVKNFEVNEDDIWLISFPKAGSTWAQEMVWLINNDLNFEEAKKELLSERFPFLDRSALTDSAVIDDRDSLEIVKKLPRPRFIKSHFTIEMLPNQIWTKKPKIVYVSRNPKDLVLSYFHFSNCYGSKSNKLEDFLDAFLNNQLLYTPFIDHNLDYFKLEKEYPNILYLSYEEMYLKMDETLEKVCKFFNKQYSASQLNSLKDHLSFDKMKDNSACNNSNEIEKLCESNNQSPEKFKFMRKGKIGSYKEEMSEEYIKKFDEWIERSLKGINHKFYLKDI